MTTSCDSQHVPQHVEQPGLGHDFPRSIEYHDTASWSDSDLRELSRLRSVRLPSEKGLRRRVKSSDDLRKAIKSRDRRMELTAVLSLICPPTASDLGHRTEETPSGVGKFCDSCLGINAENLAQPGGYKHSTLSELFRSRKWCKFCKLLAESLIRELDESIPDTTRYQIFISLRVIGDDVDVRPDSTHRRRPRSPMEHGIRTGFRQNFSQLLVDIIDLRFLEAPEDDIEAKLYLDGMSRTVLAPDGSKLRRVGGDRLYCFTEEHDPATELGIEYVRQIGSDTSSSRSFEIASEWLASCLSAESPSKLKEWKISYLFHDHSLLYRDQEAEGSKMVAYNSEAEALTEQAPLRLVEIQADAGGEATSIRVIHTDGQNYPYAALSYCWGKAPPGDTRSWQTRRATLNSHLQGINGRHLPRTLQDVIYICARLDVSYLWVDSLCIIQDDDIDWAAESAKMSGIYLGSLLTISLSTSASAESGCLNYIPQRIVESERFQREWVTIDTRSKDGRSSLLYITDAPLYDDTFQGEVRFGLLSQRAWALQEHIMPQRTLYITSKQLFWECRHCRLSEDNFPQIQEDWLYPICDYGFALDATAIFEMWYRRVVEDYTGRHLTYEKDKLVAISALARATYLNRKVDYVAGLWRDCIVPGLLWARESPGCKSKTYSCPTWSWASQSSTVTYLWARPSRYIKNRPSESFPRVQNVFWDTKPENPFGDVLSAHIDLGTTIAQGTVLRDDAFCVNYHYFDDCQIQTLIVPGSGQNGTLCATAAMDDADRGGRNVVVANMGHCFLLLEPPSLSSGEYRRVGIAFPDPIGLKGKRADMDDLTRGWTQRTIRLV